MRRIMFFKIAGQNVHIPKLAGAFIIFIALLMFFQAGALMIESWDNLKFVNNCLQTSQGYGPTFEACQEYAFDTGLTVRPGQDELNTKQYAVGLFPPIASLLFWLILLGLGIVFYKTGNLVVPIEQSVTEVKEKKVRKKKK